MAAVEALDPGTKKVFRVVSWALFITLMVLVIYGVLEAIRTPNLPVGAQWVDVYWPFPPYFAQAVTHFSVACVALFYSRLRLWEARITKWPASLISSLQ